MNGITFTAIFTKATTTVDGGWNVTLSVSNDEATKIVQLANLRETLVQVGIMPIPSEFSPEEQNG